MHKGHNVYFGMVSIVYTFVCDGKSRKPIVVNVEWLSC